MRDPGPQAYNRGPPSHPLGPMDPDDLPSELNVDVSSMVQTLSRRFHENPLAGLREAVQNALDAVRTVDEPRIEIDLTDTRVEIWDNGSGMSPAEARDRWVRVFDSEKAHDAETIGEFGIGRFALLGLGDPLVLDTHDGSQATRVTIDAQGTLTWSQGERSTRGTTVAVDGSFHDLVREAVPYLRRVAEKRPEPILVNGKQVSGKPYSARTDAIVHEFRTDHLDGALGVTDDATTRGVRVYHKGLYVETLHEDIAVTGEVNCNALNLVATRDGIREDTAYEAFRNALDEQVGRLWTKVARSPYADRFARHLFRRARETGDTELIARVPVELSDGRQVPWRDVVAEAEAEGKAITYYSGSPGQAVEDGVDRGTVLAVRVRSGDARLALHDDANRHGVESIYREDALRRRLEEEDDATVVGGEGFEALARTARNLLADEVPNLEVIFMESPTRRAELTGNLLELNVTDALLQDANDVAASDELLAQAMLAPTVAHALTRRDLNRDRLDVHDEEFQRHRDRLRDRLLRRIARLALKGP